MKRKTLRMLVLSAACIGLDPAIAAELTARTSLSDPSIRYTVPEKGYVVLRRGALEVVIVDNRAVNDENNFIPFGQFYGPLTRMKSPDGSFA